MPNGFHGTKNDWKQFESPLLELDNRIEAFAQTHQLSIIRNYHNWPGRMLTSGRSPNRSIQLYLQDQRLSTWRIGIVAYEDRRDGRYLKGKKVAVDVPEHQPQQKLEEFLEQAWAEVKTWSKRDLQKTLAP